MNVAHKPQIELERIMMFIKDQYNLEGELTLLDGERDLNYRLTMPDGGRFVVKIAHPDESIDDLDFQTRAISHVSSRFSNPSLFPQIRRSRHNNLFEHIKVQDSSCIVRIVSYLPGQPIALSPNLKHSTLYDTGSAIGEMDSVLSDFTHPSMHRYLEWDAKHAFPIIKRRVDSIQTTSDQSFINSEVQRLQSTLLPLFNTLPSQVIHNDVNDYNLLIDSDDSVSGIIDFGDMVYSYRACDPAHALAYLLLNKDNWHEVTQSFLEGYLSQCSLSDLEIGALFDLISLRLCLSVTMSAYQSSANPENSYLSISESQAWEALKRMQGDDGLTLKRSTKRFQLNQSELDQCSILNIRTKNLSQTLSTSYKTPIHIVRGIGQHLIDSEGNKYLDCVNNVCHVGHCHPKIVKAAQSQIATLNTNTRFLHSSIARYAQRLTNTLPDPLDVCFFVNSGSEANDLALRLARAHTNQTDMIVLDHAYHGHTQSLIDISPYKFNGKGGTGKPAHTHVAEFPDTLRGRFDRSMNNAGQLYAESVLNCFKHATSKHGGGAGFIAESILGVGGQVVLPDGYLKACYKHARDHGAVCIADEVQVGFGRVGSHMWAFQTQGVCPDIVTMGKPMGNGHPLAAVVTTREIADSFNNGMEYFNTYGGNPVSSEIGLAVLDVIETESLMHNAQTKGALLQQKLNALKDTYTQIGDVRGLGLFIGVEIVEDSINNKPNPQLANQIIEHLKSQFVLLSTDGSYNNVLKFKPPITMRSEHVEQFIVALIHSFESLCGSQ